MEAASSSSSACNIAAVAARFHDRASQLVSEQTSLGVALDQLKQEQTKVQSEQCTNKEKRREMLSSVRARHDDELEVMKVLDEIESKQSKARKIRFETEGLKKKVEQLRHQLGSSSREFYAIHTVETELFRRIFEGELRHNDEKRERREQTLHQFVQDTENVYEEIEELNREKQSVLEELHKIEEKAEVEDEEIAAIAMQINATLAKVCRCFSVEYSTDALEGYARLVQLKS